MCHSVIFVYITGVDPGFLERGFIMYKGVGVRFADFISFSLRDQIISFS